MTTLKIILIYVKVCEKINPMQILKDMHIIRFEKSDFIILNTYSLCRASTLNLDRKNSVETSIEL